MVDTQLLHHYQLKILLQLQPQPFSLLFLVAREKVLRAEIDKIIAEIEE